MEVRISLMRVHELAKELDINSKAIVEFLSTKNEKIKTSNNSVSEEEIAMVKKHFLPKEEVKPEVKETPVV